MNAGRVDTLVVLGVNPIYAAPADLPLREAMQKVAFRLHAGLYFDETAEQCQWHAPLQHDLESWSDARSADGTASIVQPLVRPFYAARSLHVLLDKLQGGSASDRDLVQATRRASWGSDFDARWRDALFRGFVENSAFAPVSAAPVDRSVRPRSEPDQPEELAVLLRPDPTVWDGCFADNAWLQETPKPQTTITWGNVVAISPHLASTRKITNGDEVRLSVQGREIAGPAWVQSGQEPGTITLTLGYGRARSAVPAGSATTPSRSAPRASHGISRAPRSIRRAHRKPSRAPSLTKPWTATTSFAPWTRLARKSTPKRPATARASIPSAHGKARPGECR